LFVDIDGTDDHHCLNFLIITTYILALIDVLAFQAFSICTIDKLT